MYEKIISAAKKISDSAWALADALKEELGPMHFATLGGTTSEEILANVNKQSQQWKETCSDPKKFKESLDKIREKRWKIKDIINTLSTEGFVYTESTINSLVILATEVPKNKREALNFWYEIKRCEENESNTTARKYLIADSEHNRIALEEKRRIRFENEERENKQLEKRFPTRKAKETTAPQNILHLSQTASGLAETALACCKGVGEEKVSKSHAKLIYSSAIDCANKWIQVASIIKKNTVKEFCAK